MIRSNTDICIICHEFNPDLNTLCCQQKLHYKCLARWQILCATSHKMCTCPQCRTNVYKVEKYVEELMPVKKKKRMKSIHRPSCFQCFKRPKGI